IHCMCLMSRSPTRRAMPVSQISAENLWRFCSALMPAKAIIKMMKAAIKVLGTGNNHDEKSLAGKKKCCCDFRYFSAVASNRVGMGANQFAAGDRPRHGHLAACAKQ